MVTPAALIYRRQRDALIELGGKSNVAARRENAVRQQRRDAVLSCKRRGFWATEIEYGFTAKVRSAAVATT
jgi:hypothetical protein